MKLVKFRCTWDCCKYFFKQSDYYMESAGPEGGRCCYVIRLSALYTCFIIQYKSYDSWPCSDWSLATTDSCP